MINDDIGVIGWLKNSFIDFPGTISIVLFFRNCSLRCPYCHNPDIVYNKLPFISYREILNLLDKRKGILEGVVLTGGEPTLHTNLPEIIKELRLRNLKVKLDTNGLQPEMIAFCKPDYLAMDLKGDPADYEKLGYKGGNALQKIIRSIDIVRSMGSQAEIRITVAPPFVNEDSIRNMANLLEGVSNVYLQQVVITDSVLDAAYVNEKAYPVETLQRFQEIISPQVKKCSIRGI